MNEAPKELIKYKLMRAKDALDDARILFDNGKMFSTVNRIYYAMFYTVNGLLLAKGLSSAKHSGVLSLFNKEFVNNARVEKEDGRFYNEMFEFRQKADYKDLVKFKEEDVRYWLEKAEEFVVKISNLTSELIDSK